MFFRLHRPVRDDRARMGTKADDAPRKACAMPEQSWVWPYYPLDELENRQVIAACVEEGQTTVLEVGQEPEIRDLCSGRVLRWRKIWSRYYRPAAEELTIVAKCFPGKAPGNPSWPQVEAELIVAGHESSELRKLHAPAIVRLLLKARFPGSNDLADGNDRAGAGGTGNHEETPVPRRPSEDAFKAWRLRDITGLKTQQEIADKMSEQLGRTVSQGEVSRWLSQVEKYLKAGNILPDLPAPIAEPQFIDPALIEMGGRQAQRARRQRNRRDPDAG